MSLRKLNAAKAAIKHVRAGMKLGLGTGSTAALFVELLGKQIKDGLDVICVPTSVATAQQAQSLGIPLSTLDNLSSLDLTVDGADEFDHRGDLIKGGGGALLREKIVAAASDRMIVIADPSKKVQQLGSFPLPIEIIPFGMEATKTHILHLLGEEHNNEPSLTLRVSGDGSPYVTDEANYIFDVSSCEIRNTKALHDGLNAIPGVVENGLFVQLAAQVIVGNDSGAEIIMIKQ